MTTLNIYVAASSDDAEEVSAPAVPNLTSNDLDFYSSSSSYVGIRFQSVTIPAGATINSAVVRVVAASNGTDCHHQTIYCEDIDDAPTFTTDSGNISSRTLTSASAAWDPGDVVADSTYDTSDFSTALKEVVDRGGWASGQDVAVIVNGSTAQSTHLDIYSYDSGADYPELRVDYTAAAAHAGCLVNAKRLKSKVGGGLV